MDRFFNSDSPIMVFFGKLLDSIILNVLWFLTSLPIITLGASTSSLYRVTMQLVEGKSVSPVTGYFEAFKENWHGGTQIGLIMLLVGALLGADGYIYYRMRLQNALWTIGAAVFVLIAIVYAVAFVYVFPLQAMYRNTPMQMIKNSLLIGFRYLFVTILLIAIHVAMVLVAIYLFTPILFLGEGFVALLCSYLLKNVFRTLKVAEETEADSESADAGQAGTESEAGAHEDSANATEGDAASSNAAQAGAETAPTDAEPGSPSADPQTPEAPQ